jgi:transcriptional regulator with XRE-family HTH domain
MNHKEIGGKVYDLRTMAGLSGWALARKVGMTQAQISRLENGQQGFRAGTLLKFAKVLNVAPVYFFVDGIDAVNMQLDKELAEKNTKCTRTLRRALANPVFLKFAEKCAADFKADRSRLKSMERAAKMVINI